MKRVLLTGVGGFVGTHCLEYWLQNTNWEIIGLDSFRHKGYCSRLMEVKQRVGGSWDRVKIFNHDLTVPIDPVLENQILCRHIKPTGFIEESHINYIFNLASDSAVERSAINPTHCWTNNCALIGTMLEFARKCNVEAFFQISTDEVYGEAPPLPSPGHKEWATIMPSNPYAASKAAQEALCISYWRTYNLPLVITNCMNIIGEWQDPEKFLPKIIQSIAQGKEVPIYADCEDWLAPEPNYKIGSRIYLDARNKADALRFLTTQPIARYSPTGIPDRYNICGNTELNNLELALEVARLMGKPLKYKLVPSESARPGYDRRYALDGKKLRKKGWKPPLGFAETLERIVEWTMKHPHWIV